MTDEEEPRKREHPAKRIIRERMIQKKAVLTPQGQAWADSVSCLWRLDYDPYASRIGYVIQEAERLFTTDKLRHLHYALMGCVSPTPTADRVLTEEIRTILGIPKIELGFKNLAPFYVGPGRAYKTELELAYYLSWYVQIRFYKYREYGISVLPFSDPIDAYDQLRVADTKFGLDILGVKFGEPWPEHLMMAEQMKALLDAVPK